MGPTGEAGPASKGPNGQPGCPGLAVGETPGLFINLTPSTPKNGQFFGTGEKIVFTISFASKCGPLKVTDLGRANLFLYGPRMPLATKTASKLLNAVTDRGVADKQHHFINLIAPKYGDATGGNLVVNADNTLTFTTAAVSDEAAGTYAVGIWAKSMDEKDQVFPLKDIQIKTATAETFTSGVDDTATCNNCHKGTRSGGRSYMEHTSPSSDEPIGTTPFGNFALDSEAVRTCKSCHNLDGFSPNPIVRKVHAVHRGAHMLAPGVAHPEYGLNLDDSAPNFNEIVFPSSSDGEKDCTKCHADDSWKTKPSRLACGTCHDNLFFDTGVLTPPRVFGKPYIAPSPYTSAAVAVACAVDADCASFGDLVTCNTGTGNCERTTHPPQTDDTKCGIACHTADDSPPVLGGGPYPTPGVHDIQLRTKTHGLKITNGALSGATGGGGAFFQVGDTPIVKFRLVDKSGGTVTNLTTNVGLTGTILISGPTDSPHRVYASTSLKCLPAPASCVTSGGGPNGQVGTLTYDVGTALYTYTPPTPIPAISLTPLNSNGGLGTPFPPLPGAEPGWTNAEGTYTVWVYVNEMVCLDGTAPVQLSSGSVACKPGLSSLHVTAASASVRDAANVVLNYKFLADTPIRPRKVITNEACASCHTDLSQCHGGSRRVPEACHTCHNPDAQDKGIGWTFTTAAGATYCTADTDCTGGVATSTTPQWQSCQGTPPKQKCTAILDPTASTRIDFPAHIHNIHSARLRAGWQERNNLLTPGTLNVSNDTFSTELFPQDVRNCTKCHADQGTACSIDTDCGFGQACNAAGTCTNVAWMAPSARACVTCHDTGAAYAHAQLMTWTDPSTGTAIESCNVCHGPAGNYAVSKVHDPSGFAAWNKDATQSL